MFSKVHCSGMWKYFKTFGLKISIKFQWFFTSNLKKNALLYFKWKVKDGLSWSKSIVFMGIKNLVYIFILSFFLYSTFQESDTFIYFIILLLLSIKKIWMWMIIIIIFELLWKTVFDTFRLYLTRFFCWFILSTFIWMSVYTNLFYLIASNIE